MMTQEDKELIRKKVKKMFKEIKKEEREKRKRTGNGPEFSCSLCDELQKGKMFTIETAEKKKQLCEKCAKYIATLYNEVKSSGGLE